MDQRAYLIVPVIVFACVGCGANGASKSSPGSGSGDADAGPIADVAKTICTKIVQCGMANDVTSCENVFAPNMVGLRDTFLQAWAACTRDTPCDQLVTTTTNCTGSSGGGGSGACDSSNVNTCQMAAYGDVPDSVLGPFLDGVCPHVVQCGAATDDAACRSAMTDMATVPSAVELKAFTDDDIACVADCAQAAACSALTTDLDTAVNDCAHKSCGLALGN